MKLFVKNMGVEETIASVIDFQHDDRNPDWRFSLFKAFPELDKEKGFHWIGKYDISAEDLLSGDGRGQKIRSAKEFLKEILENGSMEQAKIAEEAEERGIKKKTLWNAKKELQIDSVKIGNKWFWMLQEE